MKRIRGIRAALCTSVVGWACSESFSEPQVDPVTGTAAAAGIEGQLSLAYSHDIQGETKPCG